MNFKSDEIKIYPAANRNVSYDYLANLNTEQNIIRLSNNILDYKNYIIEGLDLSTQQITENSITNTYLVVSKGTCVINGYNIEIGSDANPSIIVEQLNTSDTFPHFIYLKLNMRTLSIPQGSTLTQLDGYDEDIADGVYTGVSLIVGDNTINEDTYTLLLGIVNYGDSNWHILPTPKKKKIYANDTYVDIKSDTNLVSEDFIGTFEDWLEKKFIVDDGNINGTSEMESPKIIIKYIDGSTLDFDVNKLNFGTTLTPDMIPSISSIESLFIPDYFTQVQEGTLNGASNLVTLSLPFTGLNNNPLNISDGLFGRIFGNTAYQNSVTVLQTSDVLTISRFNCEIPQSLTNITIRNKVSPFAFASIGNSGEEYNILTNLDISTVSDFNSDYTFATFQGLKNIILPFKLTNIGNSAFNRCINLTRIDLLSNITYIDEYAFSQSTQLSTIVINTNALVNLRNTNAFNNTLITANTGHIYVPSTLVAAYKADPTWAYFSDIIESI